jgi:hypothetical protein
MPGGSCRSQAPHARQIARASSRIGSGNFGSCPFSFVARAARSTEPGDAQGAEALQPINDAEIADLAYFVAHQR